MVQVQRPRGQCFRVHDLAAADHARDLITADFKYIHTLIVVQVPFAGYSIHIGEVDIDLLVDVSRRGIDVPQVDKSLRGVPCLLCQFPAGARLGVLPLVQDTGNGLDQDGFSWFAELSDEQEAVAGAADEQRDGCNVPNDLPLRPLPRLQFDVLQFHIDNDAPVYRLPADSLFVHGHDNGGMVTGSPETAMLHSRKAHEELERQWLAPYAARSADSHGRKFDEHHHEHRSEFQRDRDRVIHSRAFRRLEYKTQVFVNGTADHYRTRLTHTIEMTAVGRTIARALRGNEDLTEAITLAHDIGHSPFGHSGEHALNDLMKDHGGFDHNIQSVRAVEYLEYRYPRFPGLNLTWEVRAGLYKHQASIPGFSLDGLPVGPHQFLEAQIADVADDMTYHVHDIDDGIEAGLLTEADLEPLEVWQIAREHAAAEYPDLSPDRRLGVTLRSLLDLQVEDVLQNSERLLAKYAPKSPGDVMKCPERVVAFSTAMRQKLDVLRKFLFARVYWHPTVEQANKEAVDMMRSLFLHYVENPTTMGRKAQARIPQDGVWRAACDYVAGMTDRYALDEYRKFNLGPIPSHPA